MKDFIFKFYLLIYLYKNKRHFISRSRKKVYSTFENQKKKKINK